VPTSRLASFLDHLAASQLLQPAQLAEARRLAAQAGGDVRRLAQELLRRGWLTHYQINQVAAGRGKELTVGPYRILDRLGEGSMGQVFRAYHQAMQRTVALKLIRREWLARPNAVQRFYQEVRAAATLIHPNIVVAYDAGQTDHTHYFAMEYVDGVDLDRLVKESGPLPVDQACDFVRQAALGLQHAFERGMVHRDIKPSNLLVTRSARAGGTKAPRANGRSAEVVTVKILDMGLARQEGGDGKELALTHEGVVLGSPAYLSPEQALNAHASDVRSDLYSLGCTFYYLLAGRPPFQTATLTQMLLKHQMEEPAPVRQLRPDAPEGVAAVVRRLMAKRPEDRYQTPAELVQALGPWCGKDGIDAAAMTRQAPPPAPDPAAEWALLTRDSPARTAVAEGSVVRIDGRRRAARKRPWVLLGVLAGLTGLAAAAVAVLAVVAFSHTPESKTNVAAGTARQVAVGPDATARTTVPTERTSDSGEETPGGGETTTTPGPKTTQQETPRPGPGAQRPKGKSALEQEPPPERLRVPDEAEQTKAEKMIRDLFKAEYARRAPSDKVALANKLLDHGADTADNPAERFVLWREARDLAAQAADPALALRAVGRLASTYAVDELAMKRETLDKVAQAAQTQAARRALAEGALASAEEAVAADKYDAAADFLQMAKAAVSNAGSPSLAATVQARGKDVEQLRQEYERVRVSADKLKKDPTDPDANLAVGKYLCFAKGNWEKGLPLLAAGGDVKLGELVDKDLAAPTAAAEQTALADGWWDLAQGEHDPAKAHVLRRAFTWYSKALEEGLTGLTRTKAETRLMAIQEQVPGLEPPVFVKEYRWAKGEPPTPMLRTGEGFCLLASMSGRFDGIGEVLTLSPADGTWHLAGKSGNIQPIKGSAFGVQTALRRQFYLDARDLRWQTGMAPQRLLHRSDGFCFLAAVSGSFQGEEGVGVTLARDGYWYLAGDPGQKVVGIAVRMRVNTPGSFRAEIKEYRWSTGDKPVKMIAKGEGFCYLSAVGGSFRGFGEEVRVYVGPDGYWYLDGRTGGPHVRARAVSIRTATP
jgi:serine/threonine protein kinase